MGNRGANYHELDELKILAMVKNNEKLTILSRARGRVTVRSKFISAREAWALVRTVTKSKTKYEGCQPVSG